MNKAARNKFMLTATLIMFALTAALITRNEQFVFQNEGRLVVKPDRSDPDAVVFIWRSEVDVPMARRFEEAFDEWKDNSSRIIIELHSPGGMIREGEAVIREIEHWKRTHIVDTRVGPRRSCYSMCVPIFLQGEVRSAASSSRFMFHEPTAYDYFTGERVDEPTFEKERASREFVERYFVNSEMDHEWREGLVANWKGRDVRKSGQELIDEGSRIVTMLE